MFSSFITSGKVNKVELTLNNKGAIAFSKLRLHLIDQSNSAIMRMLEVIQLIFLNFITIAIFLFCKLIFR